MRLILNVVSIDIQLKVEMIKSMPSEYRIEYNKYSYMLNQLSFSN